MKAMQKFVHLCLVVAILLASSGFRVAISHCSDEKGRSIGLFAEPTCCCNKESKAPTKTCNDLLCVVQRGDATQTNFSSAIQQVAKFAKQPVTYLNFTQSIRPALLERTPPFTLPPPISGRFIGILHQTFII